MKRYETSLKCNGKFIYVGWGEMKDEKFCIKTKETKRFIYKTYRWLTGEEETYRYNKDYIED